MGTSYRYYSASGKLSLAWNVFNSIRSLTFNLIFSFVRTCLHHALCSALLLPGIRSAKTVPITYIDADGIETTVDAEIGKNLLDAAHDNNVELEGTCWWVLVLMA
jgi:hypothetical protein